MRANFEIKFSDFDLREVAFSTRSRIFETVDSPKSFVVRISMSPERLMQPLMTSLSSFTSRGMLSPVSAAVSRELLPLTITPSMGIFSPGRTTMTEPISTSSGSTVRISPSSPRRLALSGRISISAPMLRRLLPTA